MSSTDVLQVGLIGSEIFGDVGGKIFANQVRLNPSAVTLLSLIKLIVMHPEDITIGGIVVPENGPPIRGELVSGPSKILTKSYIDSVSKKVKVIV